MDVDESSSPSNHDRQEDRLGSLPAQDPESSKPFDDGSTPTIESTGRSLASDNVSLESLQKDMGDAFLLCKSSKTLISSVC